MEIAEGVFLSHISTDEWEPDTDPGGEMHVLCEVVGVYAGLSRFPAEWNEPVSWTLPARETFIVLEGEARIEIAGGPTLELKPGSMASLPKGAETTWYLTPPFREFWVLA